MTTPALASGTSGAGNPRKPWGAAQGRSASFLSTEGHRGHHGGPATILAAFGGGSDVEGPHDLARHQPLLAPRVPRLFRIERDVQHGGEHRRGQVLRIVAGGDFVLSVAVMLGDVAVM